VIIGLIFSIVSLALAIVTYEQKLYLVEGIKPNEHDSILNDDVIIKRFNQTYRITSAILFSAHLCWIGKSKQTRILFLFIYLKKLNYFVCNSCPTHRPKFVRLCFRLDCCAGLPCQPDPNFRLALEKEL
jgi:hypothetical protein